MTRGLAIGTDVPCAPPPVRRQWGRVTVRGWLAHRARTGRELRVYVDGEDVTTRAVLAHDRRGYVVLNRLDARGRMYLGPDGRIARERRAGDVRIEEAPS